MSAAENKAAVRRILETALVKGDFSIVDQLVDAKATDHGALPGSPPGREGYRMTVQTYHDCFKPTITIEDQVAEGDRVTTRFTYNATHKAPFMGIAPTGKKFSGEVISISRFANGKLVEEWTQFDTLHLAQEIGAVPAMAGALA